MTFSICLLVSENGIFASDCHLYCHRIVLSLGLLAELGGCAPTLIFNRQGQMKNDLNRNRVNLACREDGMNISATFWNGTTLLNPVLRATHIHDLKPYTEAELACSRQDGVMSQRIGLAGLLYT